MVFYWSLSDNTSPQVSRTIFSILTNLINSIVWMFSARPPISNSSSPLKGLFKAHQLQSVSPSLSCSIAFLVLWLGLSTCLSFHFLWFALYSLPGQQSSLFSRFSYFVYYHEVWSSGQDHMICLYLKIPENFVCLILQVRFLFVVIPFGFTIKFQFLAQFSVDCLLHPLTLSLILLFTIMIIKDIYFNVNTLFWSFQNILQWK